MNWSLQFRDLVKLASVAQLYHTTSVYAASAILQSGQVTPKSGETFVSFSEVPLPYGDIHSKQVILVVDAIQLASQLDRVVYSPEWFKAHPEQGSYIAGEGWREQYTEPEYEEYDDFDPNDPEWEPDVDAVQDNYQYAEMNSFLAKDREREWISKMPGEPVNVSGAVQAIMVIDPKLLEMVEQVVTELGLQIPVQPLGGRKMASNQQQDNAPAASVQEVKDFLLSKGFVVVSEDGEEVIFSKFVGREVAQHHNTYWGKNSRAVQRDSIPASLRVSVLRTRDEPYDWSVALWGKSKGQVYISSGHLGLPGAMKFNPTWQQEMDKFIGNIASFPISTCPTCGVLMQRKKYNMKRGPWAGSQQSFLGCPNYPSCNYIDRQKRGW